MTDETAIRTTRFAQRVRVDRITAEVVDGLRRDGVSPLLLKGPALTSWIYDKASERGYTDTDLLISPSEAPVATRSLSTLGFQELLSERDVPGWPSSRAEWVRASDEARVDLHQTLPGVRMDPRQSWDLLRADAETITVHGVEMLTLSKPARALHVALHAADHGIEMHQPLNDLAKALGRIDRQTWTQAADLARRLEATLSFAAGLRLSSEGRALADELGLPTELPVEVELLAGERQPGALTIEAIAKEGARKSKAGLVLRKAFPTRRFMRVWMTQHKQTRERGLAFAYLYRQVWLARQAQPALRAWRRARQRRGDQAR